MFGPWLHTRGSAELVWGGMKAMASWWHLEMLPLALSRRTVSLIALGPDLGLGIVSPAVLAAVLVWAAFSSEQLFAFWENSWLWFG